MSNLAQETKTFVDSYAAHGDRNAATGGPNWEDYGSAQFEFLMSEGLEKTDRLLDIGCGAGRFARQIVPFLDPGHYTGIDISQGALWTADQLAKAEGWADRNPRFVHGDGTLAAVRGEQFDIAWCYAAVAHMPPGLLAPLLRDVAQMIKGAGYFAFRPAGGDLVERVTWKNYRHPPELLGRWIAAAGLEGEILPDEWPNEQLILRVWR